MRRMTVALLGLVIAMAGTLETALADKVSVAVDSPVLISDTVPKRDRDRIEVSMLVGPFEEALRQSRKFELRSERDKIRARTAEQQKLKTSAFNDAGTTSMDGFKAVDYLMAVSLHDLKFRRDEDCAVSLVPGVENAADCREHSDARYRRIDIATVTVEAQVLKVGNDQIAFRDQVTKEISTDSKLVTEPGGRPDISLLSKAARKAADELVSKFLNNVFPITVLKTKQGFAFVNYGGDSLSEGEVFDVYGTDMKLEGVDTDETIEGGLHKGTVKITQVNPKYSIAEIVEKKAPISRGDVLRSK